MAKKEKKSKADIREEREIREGKALMRKNLIDGIIKNITFDKLNGKQPIFYRNAFGRLDSKVLGLALCYAIEYQKKNNQKISFMSLSLYIDKLNLTFKTS